MKKKNLNQGRLFLGKVKILDLTTQEQIVGGTGSTAITIIYKSSGCPKPDPNKTSTADCLSIIASKTFL